MSNIKTQQEILLGLMILEFAQHDFMQGLEGMSEEKMYYTLVKLLAYGALRVIVLDDGRWELRPIEDRSKWVEKPKFLETFKDSYKEVSDVLKAMKKKGYKGGYNVTN